MAISGQRFLQLSKAKAFAISTHALARTSHYAARPVDKTEAHGLFEHARQMRHEAMVGAGYRPKYKTRLKQGEKSWYFRLPAGNREMVAVVTETERRGEFLWVTTLAPNVQTERLRFAAMDLAAAA